MKNKEKFPKAANEQIENKDGYPKYPESEDIYNKYDKEFDIDPENISKKKPFEIVDEDLEWNESDIDLEHPEDDLDVPGSDLDDEQEDIGSEDEENNFYSIGGDDHNDLEEDNH
ncbi:MULTISPECIES: hypothetical protein [unclassified Flavobacterium]|uniref:hypothetical protein n=1 Tax=unclassified Flavobacterium TaxID=196869 RepID=UPI0025C0AD7A|nr:MULTISPECIES: hypothetical protein [unclassified Flavobacterium]